MLRLPNLGTFMAVLAIAALPACAGGGSNGASGASDTSGASASPGASAAAASRGARAPAASERGKPGALASESGKPAAPRKVVAPLASGTEITLRVRDSLSSRFNHVGDTVIATSAGAAVDEAGQAVIPAGAAFEGVITDIAPSSGPRSQGRLAMTFSKVRFGGHTYALEGRMVSADQSQAGRGITAGTALKVGAGAAVGGVAGRIIGGNTTGAVVGAAAGAVAGGVVAHETRRLDVVLPRGGMVKIALTAPFQP